MSIIRLFRYITVVLLFAGLPFGAFATTTTTGIISKADYYQDKRGGRQERGKGDKGGKKPEVKEVPQSRRQQKPGEVKQEKKEKPERDNKRRH
ncbi:MAG: hypothetical protein WC623_12635 [Pedobacter sp.]|uniref:hypothetical protein n=1 Tax=Pedobacter sp. TaxID=1411316 RepID=UPI0035620B55